MSTGGAAVGTTPLVALRFLTSPWPDLWPLDETDWNATRRTIWSARKVSEARDRLTRSTTRRGHGTGWERLSLPAGAASNGSYANRLGAPGTSSGGAWGCL